MEAVGAIDPSPPVFPVVRSQRPCGESKPHAVFDSFTPHPSRKRKEKEREKAEDNSRAMADDSVVQELKAAAGCSEATARELLQAAGGDIDTVSAQLRVARGREERKRRKRREKERSDRFKGLCAEEAKRQTLDDQPWPALKCAPCAALPRTGFS